MSKRRSTQIVSGITQQKTIMLTKTHLSNECRDIHWVCCKSHPKYHSSFHVQELSHKILQLFMLIQGSCTWNNRVGESSVLNKLKTEDSNSNAYPSPKDTYKSAHSRSVGCRPIIEAIQILIHCRMDQYTVGGIYIVEFSTAMRKNKLMFHATTWKTSQICGWVKKVRYVYTHIVWIHL